MSSPTNSSFTSSSPIRENRWKGPAPTWQRITEEERGLAASLDEIRNKDLSIHLYNSFALKKRARELEANDVGDDEDENRDDLNGFVPPKKWTAWPMEATEVPREGEQIGPDDGDEMFTLRKREVTKLSRDLEDILMGVTLKYARERFLERETAEDQDAHVEDGNAEEIDDETQQEPSDDAQDGVERIRKSSEPPPTTTLLRPEVSADDERSRDLLRPSVRHTLSQLDDVLMALHHARKTCRQYASQAEFDTDGESRSRATSIAGDATDRDSPVKKAVGRPRKLKSTGNPKIGPEFTPNENALDRPDLWRAKKTHRGRPKKVYARLEGESQHEYLTRIARIQKKPLPSFAPPMEPSTPKRGVTPVPVSPQKSPRKHSGKPRKHMLGLRDWSEVLGSAALAGFSPSVIARATQRCADLFEENMTMRTLVEGPAAKGKVDIVTEYYPGMIPDLGESDDHVSSSDESEEESSNPASDTENAENEESSHIKHRVHHCPVTKCQGNKDGFKTAARLLRHALAEHDLSKSELEVLNIESDDEMDGAVHIDRFLKPMKANRGWRGIDKEKRKQRKLGIYGGQEQVSATSDSDSDEDEDEVLDSHTESESESGSEERKGNEDENEEENEDAGSDDQETNMISS
ncbi:hypothetical protein SBOR_2346 [Sclerotinia borealis F-4128]|uniref:Rrn9 domain-containing protein n=1 Tax=Sclerotinia borealis (strain F-4128) TaxID=1432307 RepID=W9CKE3_SCLBF|nr:hypothetical protein SBOR_2346 [Sclerotinia borealis F-4128]